MAEYDLAKELNMPMADIEYTSVMTGDREKRAQLYYQLVSSLRKADGVDILVSFLMESGVKMLLSNLENALNRGAHIRILTGNYMGITQPSALYLIKRKLGDRVDLRFYNDKGRSFHPKSYIFHYPNHHEIYIGSSNISRSALTSGIEWNYRFSSFDDRKNYEKFFQTFEDLFEHHSIVIDDEELRRYSRNWHRPAVYKDLNRYDAAEEDADTNVRMFYEPRGAQIEALCALEDTRREGAGRALVQAATGVGKTYLAAFDSKDFARVLFVAHREEILQQAAVSFRNVRESDDYGFFDGKNKTTDKAVIFASVATLGRSEYLNENYFRPDDFDYVVIDEFHHAVNLSYRKIADYFKPKFLLGLTATPDRLDGKNIYEICDYNVPYEITLRDAINKGMLVPFRYYGIYDDTDYSGFHVVRGRYVQEELDSAYIGNVHRHDLIYKSYRKYGSRRALGFCCSRAHAEEMAKEFSVRGIPSVAVYSNASGEFSEDRTEAIRKLEDGTIQVIFSVDMFNEGVDIPTVDMVMFLRPTESPIVFLQQLGRGLRTSRGKEYLNVLDFIGNYEKAGKTRDLLTGGHGSGERGGQSQETPDLPDNCLVDFDLRLIDLFAEMEKKRLTVKERIRNEFYRVCELLDHTPSRLELFTYMDDETYQIAIKHAKDNPFKHYLAYLKELEAMPAELEETYQGIGREFISLIETTNMSKVYKMPVLLTFCSGNEVRMEVTEEELLKSWKEFFGTGTNWKDLEGVTSYEQYQSISDKEHLQKIKNMPVHFLTESGKGFFVHRDGSALALREDLREIAKSGIFAEQMSDVVEYRIMDYYQSGEYILRLGNASNQNTAVAVLTLGVEAVLEQCVNICPVQHQIQEIEVPKRQKEDTRNLPVFAMDRYIPGTVVNTYTKPEEEPDALVESMTVRQLATLVVGGGTSAKNVQVEAKGASGTSTPLLYDELGIPNVILSDGPAGLNLTSQVVELPDGTLKAAKVPETLEAYKRYLFGFSRLAMMSQMADPADGTVHYQYATAWPCSQLLAQTFDTKLMEQVGDGVGTEMEAFGVTIWLAPGMNIHRNPLCGRTFEYYSEDPLVSGKMAAAIVRGVQKHPGKGMSVKHFAANSCELERNRSSSNLSERALREIYLHGFEIAVKESKPMTVMAAYNKINGVYCTNNYDLLVKVLRNEWGFEGLVMSDWDAISCDRTDCMKPDTGDILKAQSAQCDLAMPGNPRLVEALCKGVEQELTDIHDLKRSAVRMLKIIRNNTILESK